MPPPDLLEIAPETRMFPGGDGRKTRFLRVNCRTRVASFMLQRAENGDLALDDIPVRLARYGLMEPNAFVAEMRERMKLSKSDE